MVASASARLTLHWLERSRAQRVIWLLEELRLQYRLVTYKRLPDNQAPVALKAAHPLGRSPVLEVSRPHWTKPLVLAESANIIEYLAEHFGSDIMPDRWRTEPEVQGGLREETEEWLKYRFYMHYSEGSLMSLIGSGALKNGIKDAQVPFFIKPVTARIAGLIESSYLNHNYNTHLSFLESELSSHKTTTPFITGPKLTAADFMMAFPLEAAQQIAGLTEARYPLLTGYLRRLQRREAYKKAIDRVVKETGSYHPGI